MSSNSPKRVLIVRPDRLGDVVLATPLPREIKRSFPDSFVAVMIRSYAAPVFEHNPFVDEIILADDFLSKTKGSFWRCLKKLRALELNHALMLLPHERINYLLFAAGIKVRVGTGHKFFQFITNVKSVSRNKYKPLRHEADYCMDLARKIGVVSWNYRTEIFLSAEEKLRAAEIRKRMDEKKKIIGVHFGSGNSCPNLKAGEYLRLIRLLQSEKKYEIFVTDVELPREIEKNLEGVHRVGKGLRNLFIVLKSLDLFISSSTGPSHAAAALEVPTLTLFCRLPACSPWLWSPMGNEAIYLQPEEKYCESKCPQNPKICNFDDGGITAEKIFGEIENYLFEKRSNNN